MSREVENGIDEYISSLLILKDQYEKLRKKECNDKQGKLVFLCNFDRKLQDNRETIKILSANL